VIALVGYIALRPAEKISAPPATPAPAPSVAEAKATPTAPAASKIFNKSIAVLPLANMSEDKDTGFFADGVHEDLLTNLALVSELKVVSRTSVMQYRGTTKTMKQIGEELGVAYVLEGSVRRSGNRVRVTGQLINTRTDEHVWAKSYDRDLTDIFSIQAELSKEIAGALSAAISPQTQKFLDRRPTENPVAYDSFLRARDLRNRAPTASRPAMREQEALFKSAVQQDPKFAAAWGELATVHAQNAFWGIDASAARLAEGDAAIAEAERLAPEAPDVIRTVGTYAYYARRDYAKATAQYEKLARLQPNDPTVFSSLALILRREGRWTEAINYGRRAIELDPANISYVRNLGRTLMLVRRWDDARATQQRLIELMPGQLRERLILADGEFNVTGSLVAADTLLASLSRTERDSSLVVYFRKGWAINRGDYAEFKRLDQLLPDYEELEDSKLSAWIAGDVYAAVGDVETLRARIAGPMAEARAQTQREPSNERAWAFLGAFEALSGNATEAVRLARKAADLRPLSGDAVDGPVSLFNLAWIYATTGDKDRAIAALTELLRVPSSFPVPYLRIGPGFRSLRGDPRFEALVNDPKNNAPLF
jgi:TolB-like protein/Flp pilus assembly protein TadD